MNVNKLSMLHSAGRTDSTICVVVDRYPRGILRLRSAACCVQVVAQGCRNNRAAGLSTCGNVHSNALHTFFRYRMNQLYVVCIRTV